MNNFTTLASRLAAILLIAGLSLPGLSAQNSQQNAIATIDDPTPPKTETEVRSRTKKSKRSTKIDVYRHHRAMPAGYDGYVVELILAERPLARNHQLFNQFGSVYYDLTPEGKYAYCLLVDFSRRSALEQYVKKMIIHRAPEARVVEYRDGKRKKN